MTASHPGQMVDAFIDHAIVGDIRGAVHIAIELLDDGVPEEIVITQLLAPAQHQVGERWHRNELTVAHEHLATGATESALRALEGTSSPPSRPGLVVVACAEGDWHGVAAHMFAARLRTRGFKVVMLGASTPAEHVATFIQRTPTDALAISCNLPLYLSGVSRLCEVAHAEGVPVLAGGRSLEAGPERAHRLGADSWANGMGRAEALLDDWCHGRPAIRDGPIHLDPDAMGLDDDAHQLAAVAFDDLSRRLPSMGSLNANQLTRTREDLAFIVRFVAAAQLVDDPTILTEFLDWLTLLLGARHVPAAALLAGLGSLQPLLEGASAEAGRLGEIGLEHLSYRADVAASEVLHDTFFASDHSRSRS